MDAAREFARSIGDRWIAQARTRRGIVVNLLAAFLALGLFGALASDPQDGVTAGGILVGILVGVPLAWGIAWVVVAIAAAMWESRTHPATPAYARRQASSGTGAMLRRDHNARFWHDRGGFLWSKRYWFAATGCPPVEFSPAEYLRLVVRSRRDDVPVPVVRSGPRQWWWWQEDFYWETGEYAAADVKALLFQRERRKKRELEHAHTLMALNEMPEPPRKREAISEEVKLFVYRRDEGRCQQCGSRELVQFDHIIPFSMGGSSEPENLQLLCARCNREKGGRMQARDQARCRR